MPARDPLLSPRALPFARGNSKPTNTIGTSYSSDSAATPPVMTSFAPSLGATPSRSQRNPTAFANHLNPWRRPRSPPPALYLPETSVRYQPDLESSGDEGDDEDRRDVRRHARTDPNGVHNNPLGPPQLSNRAMASPPSTGMRTSASPGLHHRRSSSSSLASIQGIHAPTSFSFSDTPDVIRARTAFLSDMPYRRSPAHSGPISLPPTPFLHPASDDESESERRPTRATTVGGPNPSNLSTLSERSSPADSPRNGSPAGPSGLSRMFADKSRSRSPAARREDVPEPSKPIPIRRPRSEGSFQSATPRDEETTLLLPPANGHTVYGTVEARTVLEVHHRPPGPFSRKAFLGRTVDRTKRVARTLASKNTYVDLAKDGVSSIPAVILGLLLNVLDGVSYGFIMFPTGAIFAGFGGIGVSMFFVTTIVAQLVYSLGGSMFAGANGSMMIEVVPFFHILVNGIIDDIGEDDPEAVIATTMVAFAFSSIITGLSFYLLGRFKLGNIIGFFPRHILVGCIGGVGVFLVETGLEVSASLNDAEGFTYTWKTAKLFLGNPHIISLWLPAFGLAVLLRIITHRFHHQLIFPIYMLGIVVVFYIVKATIGADLPSLRRSGWVFDVGEQDAPWYQFYSYFNLRKTSFPTLLRIMPTQLALLFFNILHPPLNVPALAVSLGADDVDTNRELMAHGYSNVLAGLLGTVPNYLVYVNTVMFYRVGGGSRLSGLMLAAGTVVLLIVGTEPIGYIPIMLVGALIFVLGIDLIKEAVWDTRHRTSRTEYITIIAIMVCMSLWDFVIGVLFGIVLACFFFVVQNSQRRSVRAIYTGASSMSAVRRPSAHREYLREVGKQTIIMRLQGFLFFGTITFVEETIRKFIEQAAWEEQPIRFLVIDLALVGGVDMSSAEAFGRVHRLLSAKGVILIFCGIAPESPVAHALQSVDLWTDQGLGVEVFEDLNNALEWTENAYLRAWFSSALREQKPERVEQPIQFPGPRQHSPITLGGESFINSPRRSHLHDVGTRIMPPEITGSPETQPSEPINTLMKAFSSYAETLDDSFFAELVPYLSQLAVPEGHILFNQGDVPDGLYLIEHGVLRAMYRFKAEHASTVEESMVSGTLAGELSALSGLPRNATVVAERQSLLWKLSLEELERLEKDRPNTAKMFIKLILKAAKTDYDVLLTSMASRA